MVLTGRPESADPESADVAAGRSNSVAGVAFCVVLLGLGLLGVAPDAYGQTGRARRAAAPAPSVQVRLDRKSLTQDDELVAELVMAGEFDRYTEPDSKDFQVVGRSTSSQIQFINGKMSQSKTITLRLSPKRAGTLPIGIARLYRDNQVVAQSTPLQVRVAKVNEPPPVPAGRAPSAAAAANKAVFMQGELQRSSYYVGEPFVVNWTLYFRPDSGVSSVEPLATPRLEGLLAEELLPADRKPNVREKRIRGRRFRYIQQSQQLLTGLKPGRVVIDPLKVRVTLGGFFNQRRETIRSKAVSLEVKPLPESGRPQWFREGNVGRFNLAGTLRNADGVQPEKVQTGERLIMELKVSGEGALVSLKAPVLEPVDGFQIDMMPGAGDDEILKNGAGMHGHRTFQYLVTATKPGKRKLPTVRLAYFDPRAGSYRTLTWEGTTLDVAGRALLDAAAGELLRGDDISAQIDGHQLVSQEREEVSSSWLFWLLLGVPFIGLLGVEGRYQLARARARDPEGRRSKGAFANARKRLDVAESLLKGGLVKDFYGHISRALLSYFEERANLPATGMTHDDLRTAATDVGYEPALVDEVIVELENSDFARFAPAASADERMKEALARVRDILARLERAAPKRRP